MAQVRVREVVGTMRVVDGEALLAPAVMERIVSAVLAALQGERRDEDGRRSDTRIGEGAGCGCARGERS